MLKEIKILPENIRASTILYNRKWLEKIVFKLFRYLSIGHFFPFYLHCIVLHQFQACVPKIRFVYSIKISNMSVVCDPIHTGLDKSLETPS
jgi:hypothetical protein